MNPIAAFLPNRVISPVLFRLIVAAEVGLFLLLWIFSPFAILPRPGEVFAALGELFQKQGLGQDLLVSLKLNLDALWRSSLLALGLAYLTVLPAVRPLAGAVAKGRFLCLAGFSTLFMAQTGGGYRLKLVLLVFGMTVFLVTSLVSVVAEIPKSEFDHARTLRMGEWRVVWEVVVRGTLDRALDAIRQNAAIGWAMLTVVEGIVRGEGGIGTALLNEQKHFRLADVFAIQLVFLAVGLLQDYALGLIRQIVCPYADLAKERKDG